MVEAIAADNDGVGMVCQTIEVSMASFIPGDQINEPQNFHLIVDHLTLNLLKTGLRYSSPNGLCSRSNLYGLWQWGGNDWTPIDYRATADRVFTLSGEAAGHWSWCWAAV